MTSNRNWLLLALASAEDGRMSPLQLQKAMFLMRMEADDLLGPQFYRFVPYNYGPFNSTIYSDIEALRHEGLVLNESEGRHWPTHMITPDGLKRVEQVRDSADTPLVDFLKQVVDWVKGQTFASLLTAIYDKYPDYARNSVFRN